jgi:hypothetical protein
LKNKVHLKNKCYSFNFLAALANSRVRITQQFKRNDVHDQRANLKHGPFYERITQSLARKIKVENLPEDFSKLPLME